MVPYSDAPAALCDIFSGKHWVQTSCQCINKGCALY